MSEREASTALPIVIAITGASGAVFSTRLLQALLHYGQRVHLIVSESGAAVISQELDTDFDLHGNNVESLLIHSDRFLEVAAEDPWSIDNTVHRLRNQLVVHHYKDYFTPVASGSYLTDAMIICPCSGSTLSGIAHAASQNLIQRAADVHLKEKRKLILVPRESPLSVMQIENMHRLAQAGAVILPAAPGWYQAPSRLLDLVDFIVRRILDQLGIAVKGSHRWCAPQWSLIQDPASETSAQPVKKSASSQLD